MHIATIVSSNSHIDYVARVLDRLDVAEPPKSTDYGFGTFVMIGLDGIGKAVGVVYNSILVNPDYAGFGPRLSPQSQLERFSPDFLNEQGSLLGILLLGQLDASGIPAQGIPETVIPAGSIVEAMAEDELARFHVSPSGMAIHYYSQISIHAGAFGTPLLENIIARLLALDNCSEEDRKKLAVLGRSLAWQRTVGERRL